jgi:molybdopterin synthase catalytic subunit
MARVLVQTEPFDVAAETARLTDGRTDVGGVGSFLGIVRGTAAGEPIESMTLEHYPAMTEAALSAITAEAERRWSLLGCTVIHRVGVLQPGEAIVLVLATATHRQAALDATDFLIDWLKTKAPFWKKERFLGGEERWVAATAEDAAAASRW